MLEPVVLQTVNDDVTYLPIDDINYPEDDITLPRASQYTVINQRAIICSTSANQEFYGSAMVELETTLDF